MAINLQPVPRCGFCEGLDRRHNPKPLPYKWGFYHEARPNNFGYGHCQCLANTGQLVLQFPKGEQA